MEKEEKEKFNNMVLYRIFKHIFPCLPYFLPSILLSSVRILVYNDIYFQVLQQLEDGEITLLYVTPEYIVNNNQLLKQKLGSLDRYNRRFLCLHLYFVFG